DEPRRFKGPDAARKFLDAFAMSCSPPNQHLVAGAPAGPLYSYVNADSWTDQPYAPGVVLIGDAAGWNDPIVGLGLSITYRDVRLVSELLKSTDIWTIETLRPYGEERAERMRRLRFAASLQAGLDMEFGETARARRRRHFEQSVTDPTLGIHGLAVMAGPEAAPAEFFTEQHRARVLGLAET
ncbi:MAG: monooxygenase, partial [Phenylobacterium sp.]|nr:monooxygenase [Phenylobacterium sp.]